MNTVRSEKDSMGRLMSRQISCGAHKLNARWSFPHFDGENAHLTDSCAGANQRAAAKVNEDLGLLSEEKASAFVRRRMKYWQDSMTMNSRWNLADRLRHAK